MTLKNWFASGVLVLSSLGVSMPAHALVFGYYETFGATANLAGAITASGNTAVQLNNLAAANLAGIDVLWILNSANGAPDATVLNNSAAIAAFVNGGGVLSFHDRNVNQGMSAATYIPGAGGVTFVSDLSSNIDVLGTAPATIINGPAGVIGNTTLDGGNFSNHGYATLGSLPAGATAVFDTGTSGNIVDFYFSLGAGDVYYSSIPLDFYLSGAGNNPPANAFRQIYAVNEATFQAQLRAANAAVPIPSTLLLTGLALGFLGLVRRRLA